jgi:hypothetical protein
MIQDFSNQKYYRIPYSVKINWVERWNMIKKSFDYLIMGFIGYKKIECLCGALGKTHYDKNNISLYCACDCHEKERFQGID